MNFSKKVKNFAMLSVACMSTGLTALAPVVSAIQLNQMLT